MMKKFTRAGSPARFIFGLTFPALLLLLFAIVLYLATAAHADTGFDFRTRGTREQTYLVFNAPPSMPSPSQTQTALLVIDPTCYCLAISENGGAYVRLRDLVSGGGGGEHWHAASTVTATPFATITGTNVQTQLQQINSRITAQTVSSVFGRSGPITAEAGDYTASKITVTASGGVSSTNAQNAFVELDSEKIGKATNDTISGQKTFTAQTLPILLRPASTPPANSIMLDLRSSTDVQKFTVDAEGDVSLRNLTVTGSATIPGFLTTSANTFTARQTITAPSDTAGSLRITDVTGANLRHELYGNGAAHLGYTGTGGVTLGLGGGNVGVGTTATAPLHVAKATTDATLWQEVLRLETTGRTTSGSINRATLLSFKDGSNPTFVGAIGGLREAASGHWGGGLTFYTTDGTATHTPSTDLLVERMRMTSQGYVGIGGAPTQQLEIISSGAAYGRTRSTGAEYSGWLSQNTNRQWFVGVQTASANFTIRDVSAGADRLRVDSSGNVGIGMAPSSTSAPFTVQKTSDAAGRVAVFYGTSAVAANTGAGIGIGGLYTGSAGFATFAEIHGLKANATDLNIAGYMSLRTRDVGGGVGERMKLDTAGATFSASITERGRSVPMGEWISFTPSLTATGGGSVTGGTVNSAKYTLIGKTMIVNVEMTGLSVAGNVSYFALTLPGGAVAPVTQRAHTLQYREGGATSGSGMVSVLSTNLYVQKGYDIVPFAAGALNIAFSFSFEVQ